MDISKARIAGPCSVVFKGIDYGHTLDGVEFTVERDFADVNVDKYGTTPIDKVLTGSRVMIKVKFAQPDFRQFDAAMPETSSFDGTGTLDRVDLGGDTGYSLRLDAGLLIIHPLKNGGGVQEDINIYRAVSVENITVPYKIDEQEVIEVTFMGLVDESYGPGRRLGHIGAGNVS